MNNNSSKKPPCPYCGWEHTVKNGSTHNRKQKYKCKDCGKQFVENPTNKTISSETKELIDNLLVEELPFAAIARVTKVSKTWLHNYVNKKSAETPGQVKNSKTPKKKGNR